MYEAKQTADFLHVHELGEARGSLARIRGNGRAILAECQLHVPASLA